MRSSLKYLQKAFLLVSYCFMPHRSVKCLKSEKKGAAIDVIVIFLTATIKFLLHFKRKKKN